MASGFDFRCIAWDDVAVIPELVRLLQTGRFLGKCGALARMRCQWWFMQYRPVSEETLIRFSEGREQCADLTNGQRSLR